MSAPCRILKTVIFSKIRENPHRITKRFSWDRSRLWNCDIDNSFPKHSTKKLPTLQSLGLTKGTNYSKYVVFSNFSNCFTILIFLTMILVVSKSCRPFLNLLVIVRHQKDTLKTPTQNKGQSTKEGHCLSCLMGQHLK